MQKDGTWDKYCQIMTAAVWRGTWQEFIPEAPYFATGVSSTEGYSTVPLHLGHEIPPSRNGMTLLYRFMDSIWPIHLLCGFVHVTQRGAISDARFSPFDRPSETCTKGDYS